MKYFGTLNFSTISLLVYSSMAMVPPPPAHTLAQDLDEIARMIPIMPIQQLTIRYLLNDEQFQAFVRIINCNDAHMTQMRFRSQPEVLDFINWVRQQIMLSDGELQLEESEQCFSILGRGPFDSNIVFGWQGFVTEFNLYYPEDMIRSHIQLKVGQNGIFSEFVQRLQALRPVYDRIIEFPEVQRLAAVLEAKGINVTHLHSFIRNQFGWQHTRSVSPTTNRIANISLTTDLHISSIAPFA